MSVLSQSTWSHAPPWVLRSVMQCAVSLVSHGGMYQFSWVKNSRLFSLFPPRRPCQAFVPSM